MWKIYQICYWQVKTVLYEAKGGKQTTLLWFLDCGGPLNLLQMNIWRRKRGDSQKPQKWLGNIWAAPNPRWQLVQPRKQFSDSCEFVELLQAHAVLGKDALELSVVSPREDRLVLTPKKTATCAWTGRHKNMILEDSTTSPSKSP